jgi:hypothetical protein
MFFPFGAAFSLWSAEYFARAAGYSGQLLQVSLYGVPLLLAASGFEMTGLGDGERVHPLLGAYSPSPSAHHPLPWLTPKFALLASVGLMVVTGSVLIPRVRNDPDTLSLIIEAIVNSASLCIFGLGLLRILNAQKLLIQWAVGQRTFFLGLQVFSGLFFFGHIFLPELALLLSFSQFHYLLKRASLFLC